MDGFMLDLGSGDGKNTPPGEWIKIDKNPYFKPDWVWDLNRGIPLCDQTCRVVRTFHCLEHLSDLVFISNEIFRVLKPGGLWLIDGPHHASEAAWSDFTHVRALGVNLDWQLHEPHPQAGLNCCFETVEKYDEQFARQTGSVHFVLKSAATGPTVGSLAHASHNLALDLGAGNAAIESDLLATYGDDLINIDKDWTLVGRAHSGKLVIRDIDRHNLPFCDNSVQYARLRDVAEHLRSFTAVMNDIYRCLKHGGILDIKGPAPFSGFDIGNPDHIRRVGPYTIEHFLEPIPNCGIQTRFKVIRNEIEGPYLFAVLEADKSQPTPLTADYGDNRH